MKADVDKRDLFDLQHNYGLLENKNRTLMTEVMQLRRMNDQKDSQVEILNRKLAGADKAVAMVKL